MEGGNGKAIKTTPLSLNADDMNGLDPSLLKSHPASVTITLTPDEITQTKQFEARLKQALEQSKQLQIQQMKQISTLEQEITLANKDQGLGVIDAVSEKPKLKKVKKLKGILKKPKQ